MSRATSAAMNILTVVRDSDLEKLMIVLMQQFCRSTKHPRQ